MLAETLMRQLVFGESHGVGIIRTFQGHCARFLTDTALEEALQAQIADESRHARVYARLLVKRGGKWLVDEITLAIVWSHIGRPAGQ